MKCTNKEQESCDKEKFGCEGCYYNDEEIDKENTKQNNSQK